MLVHCLWQLMSSLYDTMCTYIIVYLQEEITDDIERN